MVISEILLGVLVVNLITSAMALVLNIRNRRVTKAKFEALEAQVEAKDGEIAFLKDYCALPPAYERYYDRIAEVFGARVRECNDLKRELEALKAPQRNVQVDSLHTEM